MATADGTDPGISDEVLSSWHGGRLSRRPGPAQDAELITPSARAVLTRLGDGPRAALLFSPSELPASPVPLVVAFHGADGEPTRTVQLFQKEAERRKFLVLAPKSRFATWDVISGGLGPDVGALDIALGTVFERFGVDADRVASAGFSDGASYALTLGLMNGDLFSRVFAFSPGFVVPGERRGRPRVFLSHGRADTVLPIDRCGRRIVATLRSEGYDVDYREFAGGHEVPPDLVTAATGPLTS
jgi:phospholipase/carboxylesterase